MISSIIFLLVANTFLPLAPIPSSVLIALPILPIIEGSTFISVYDYLNISRIHTSEQFRKSYREAIKVLHPDRGGNSQTFAYIRNMKPILEGNSSLYDTLNITSTDTMLNQPLKDVVKTKQLIYTTFTVIYYLITLLYSITFTIDDNLKPSRKIIVPLICIFGGYQYFSYSNPHLITPIDIIFPKMPLFLQYFLIRNILSMFIAIIRTKYIRRNNPEKQIYKQIQIEDKPQSYYLNLLQSLQKIYRGKAQQKKQNQSSWITKIKSYISTTITILILGSVVVGLFSSG